MGVRLGPHHVLEWQSTLGAMARCGTRVIIACPTRSCRKGGPADIAQLLEEFGPDGSLWNRQPLCPACGRPGHYMASPAPNTPFLPLLAEGGVQGLPASTVPHPNARQAFLQSFGFSRRDIARIRAMAERTTATFTPAALADLDAPYRVGASMPEMVRHSTGLVLGEWAGRVLLWWPMNERERGAWAARPKGPRRV